MDDNLINAEKYFDLNLIEVQEKIGEGSFGKVFKVKEKRTGAIFAAKMSMFNSDDDGNLKDLILNLVREINIISKLNHPSIVKFIGFNPYNFEKCLNPIIITEFVQKGSLAEIRYQLE